MKINEFIEQLKDVLEIEGREVEPTDEFRNYDEWDSLAYLSVIAFYDEEFDIQIEESSFKLLKTVEDLFHATKK